MILRRILILVISIFIAVGIAWLGWRLRIDWLRPERSAYSMELVPGLHYRREARSSPRPLLIHILTVDLHQPGLGVLVTPGNRTERGEISARTTSAFAREFGVQVAINGSFFEPFHAGAWPWDYYPHSGDPVDVTGLAISDGRIYSSADNKHPVLCIVGDRFTLGSLQCPPATTEALAGDRVLVQAGKLSYSERAPALHPRTMVALAPNGNTLWLVIVDGRQTGYSEGVTLTELAEIALELGADSAMSLDGGGSSTLVAAIHGEVRVLNSPIHQDIPMFERPVANHLGVYVSD
ncbi:MAG: phosphodiester glycosidase family protein [Caldilineales bacterium]|nr:phosphodiester glycosidase family protein [Caldilineales bacterium]MCW5860004.1 phosphodiester glycosidase family protein [Caldilineales bacterium]